MKRLLFILLIFILPVFLFSQEQNTAQEFQDRDREGDVPDREVIQPPQVSMENYGKMLETPPPVSVAVPAQLNDINERERSIPEREVIQPPRVSMEDYGKQPEAPPPVSSTAPVEIEVINDRERDIGSKSVIVPEKIEPSEYYQSED
jgi:hypothetical protein